MSKTTSRPRRTQAERSATTREALLNAAIDTICEVGFDNTTNQQIAERANVSRGAVQHHFGSKKEFITAVLDRALSDLDFDIDYKRLRKQPLRERISLLLEHLARVYANKTFLATIDIWFSVGNDADLHDRLSSTTHQAGETTSKIWQTVFYDVEIPSERLLAVRRAVTASLNGNAILAHLGVPTTSGDFLIELSEMVYHHLREFMPSQPAEA